MPKLFRWQRDLDPFEEALQFHALKSERLRVAILMGFTGVSALLVTVGWLWFREGLAPVARVFGGMAFFEALPFFIFAFFAYETFLYLMLGVAVTRRLQVPAPPRYGNAFVEMTVPTLALLILARTAGPDLALQAPPQLLYTVFIMLSTLRLDFKLSLFTGLVGGLQYAGLALWLFRGRTGDAFDDAWVHVMPKAGFLVLTGAMAGFVAARIRRHIRAAVDLAEERNRVVGLFGQHVSPQVVDKLLAQKRPEDGELRHVAVLFLDIRGFTKFSESKSPAEVVAFLNALFSRHIEIVNEHGGIINKFLGDGFMAVFGTPISNGNDCRHALAAALALADATDALVRDGVIPPTRIGIGIHAGDAVTGSVGSARRREYTIIGDTVNLASRVEALNKEFGSTILATEAAFEPAKDAFPAEALAPVVIRGREQDVRIWRLR